MFIFLEAESSKKSVHQRLGMQLEIAGKSSKVEKVNILSISTVLWLFLNCNAFCTSFYGI